MKSALLPLAVMVTLATLALSLAQEEVVKFLATFKEFPPSQRAQSVTIDQLIEKMQKSLEGVGK